MSESHSSRKADLHIAADVADQINAFEADNFILTGSYSIDLLTGAEVKHNDIDANVFTDSKQESIGRVALLLGSHKSLTKILHTDSRLEYSYVDGDRTRELELQFVQYTDAVQHSDRTDFILHSQAIDRSVIVPTVFRRADIASASDESYSFQLKSLEFAIATWALRISGLALNQKRQVRQTDIDHFAYLVNTSHSNDSVNFSIEHHPQMPQSIDPSLVYSKALSLVIGSDQ